MGSQRENRLDVRLLGLCWFLTSILLAADLVFPAPAPHSLSCYYCPLQNKSKSCHNITSHCLPNQHCSSSRGHYGPVHILSAQGCLDGELCGSHEMISYRGVKYNVTHTCCCKDNCNEWAKSDADLKKPLVMSPEHWDSCRTCCSSCMLLCCGSTFSPRCFAATCSASTAPSWRRRSGLSLL
ncbi:protein Bouncer-like [Anabas testudineus]|uniref:protein Bouncer-like n=1 Tax=Anabas testudineus TaxID=64144 RepID=UPI000E466255|nr:protein Bouncer-like [Anabas testudineus]